jgi:hypothetical protein
LTWEAPTFTGGSVILDYRVKIAEQGQTFSILANSLTDLTVTAENLNFGTTYEFKVEARNEYGYSLDSDVLSLLCAFKPEPPLVLSSANSMDRVVITWDQPVNNGAEITGYLVYFQQTDGATYSQESAPLDCDGSLPEIISARTCEVTLDTLKAAPFNLVKDQEVWVRIVTQNSYGDSALSGAGNGAVIWYVPDAPVTLENDASVTDDTKIRFTWQDGPSDGST